MGNGSRYRHARLDRIEEAVNAIGIHKSFLAWRNGLISDLKTCLRVPMQRIALTRCGTTGPARAVQSSQALISLKMFLCDFMINTRIS